MANKPISLFEPAILKSAALAAFAKMSPLKLWRNPVMFATELAAILDRIFASHPWPTWRKRLRHHDITFGLLGVVRDVPDDEQAIANGSIVPSTVPEMPRTISAPIRLSFAPVTVAPGPGPTYGQHTDELLAELGYSTTEMGQLRQAGAVG